MTLFFLPEYVANFPLKQTPALDAPVQLIAQSPFLDEFENRKIKLAKVNILQKKEHPVIFFFFKASNSCTWRTHFDVASVGPFQGLKTHLQTQHILFQVSIQDDVCGYAVLPLNEVMKKSLCPFCLEITYKGLIWGHLTGTVDKLWSRLSNQDK